MNPEKAKMIGDGNSSVKRLTHEEGLKRVERMKRGIPFQNDLSYEDEVDDLWNVLAEKKAGDIHMIKKQMLKDLDESIENSPDELSEEKLIIERDYTSAVIDNILALMASSKKDDIFHKLAQNPIEIVKADTASRVNLADFIDLYNQAIRALSIKKYPKVFDTALQMIRDNESEFDKKSTELLWKEINKL